MYLHHCRTIVVEIPKAGSSAIRHAFRHHSRFWAGHQTIWNMRRFCAEEGYPVDREVAVHREPVAKFVSAVNFRADQGNAGIDDVLTAAFREKIDKAFWRTTDMVDNSVELWPFDAVDDLIAELGGEPEKVNVSRKLFTVDDVMAHPRSSGMAEWLAADVELWNRRKERRYAEDPDNL